MEVVMRNKYKNKAYLLVIMILSLSIFWGAIASLFTQNTNLNPRDDQNIRDTGLPDNGEVDNPNDNVNIPDNTNPDDNVTPKPPTADNPTVKPKITDTLIRSGANSIAIRSGAGDNYTKVGTMDKNDCVAYMGEQGEWYKTIYKEKVAYVPKKYATKLEFDIGNERTEKAINIGKSLLGYPYVWGAERYHYGTDKINKSFKNGQFDCSSFTQYIHYKNDKTILSATSRTQAVNGIAISRKNIQRGDLLFFTNSSRKNNKGIERIGHVAIYLGNNYILHTASDYAVIEEISATRWSYYISARRV